MPTPSSRRTWVRPALLLPFLALACNPPPPPTIPDPPQVRLIVDEPSTVGRSVKLSLSTSGCDQVRSLELLDHNELLKQVTYAGSPTPVELGASELRYSRGISAHLSLTARVTCDDGRTNVSQAQSATFFPVEDVMEPINSTTPVVPDYFVVDGSGANASFIGCGKEGTRSFLYKVPRSNPANRQKKEMDFPCDATTIITDRKPAGTGHRWVWTKDQGAIALDANFNIVTVPAIEAVEHLAVAPDGNAFIYDDAYLDLVTPKGDTKPILEIADPQNNSIGLIYGDPFVRPDGKILIPLYDDRLETHIFVGILNSDGTGFVRYEIDRFPLYQYPPVAFDPTGTVLYVATQSTQGPASADVRACTIVSTKLCVASGSRLWISEPLPGYMAALVPYDNGRRLAAIGANRFWFLDARSDQSTRGQIMNKDQLPLTASGTLVARFAQPGPGSAFYMFTSATGPDETPPYPVEIVATDAAEKGELFRYQVPGGSLYGAVDDTDALWLRVGNRLVKPFSPQQYREMR